MNQKKLLLLGGSAQQIIAVKRAKELGYFTILCDYLPDNPAQNFADKFYLVSTTDRQAVLAVAKKEKIDGVVAYASDPAAPTAAFVAEKLCLATSPLKSVETLCNKDMFRNFLRNNGFNTPATFSFEDRESAILQAKKFPYPVIVKPVDSSGSKGTTVLRNCNDLEKAVDFAFEFTRAGRIIVEEFVEKKHPYLIGGDIFVINGKIEMWGLLNCHRDNNANPLVPAGKSYPLAIEESDIENVKQTLQKIVDCLEIKNSAMNVELVVDKNNQVWPIDIGPRNGGNMIPDLLGLIFGVDVVELTIKCAMNEKIQNNIGSGIPFYATHNLHSVKTGILEKITFDADLEPFIIRKEIYRQKGDTVEYFDNSTKALGIIFLKFESQDQMLHNLEGINQKIHIDLG